MGEHGSAWAFTHPVEVTLRDLDGLGHVNNAVYLTYLETTRNHYVFKLTGKRRLTDFDFILARTAIDFRAPAEFQERLEVRLRPGRIGDRSFTFEYQVRAAAGQGPGRLVAEAESVQVAFNYQTQKSMALPQELRRLLEAERQRIGAASPAEPGRATMGE